MRRCRFLLLLLAVLAPRAGAAQETLIPSDRAPYRQKFDLLVPDAQFLFLPQSGRVPEAPAPLHFRFAHPALNAVLDGPFTVHYLTLGSGGYLLQVLNLRPTDLPEAALGPQAFEVSDSAGTVAGRGTILVLGRPPEAAGLAGADGNLVFEVGRAAPVRMHVRTGGNYRGGARVVNRREYELTALREEVDSVAGVAILEGVLRPLRADAGDLRLAVETADGRTHELAFSGITVRAPVPRRVQVVGGPIYLDALGRGRATLQLRGLPETLGPEVEVGAEGGELMVGDFVFDPAERTLRTEVEFVARSSRPAGAREVRELLVRAGGQVYRGLVEVVGAATVSGARTDRDGRAVLPIGGGATVLRITGQNLDGMRLDCAPLGPGAECRTLASSPTELVAEAVLGGEVRDGEIVLPLVPTGGRAVGEAAAGPTVRVQTERPAIPLSLRTAGLLSLECGGARRCRRTRADSALVVDPGSAALVRLVLDEDGIPVEHGWQRLVITVTRVRGEQRQQVRAFGSPGAPRSFRAGADAGQLTLLDATMDPRHGDQFLVRVEHAVEQYPAEYRGGPVTSEAYVARIYIDGGLARRFSGDIAVQPIFLSVVPGGEVKPLYPNAGLGVTWQFLNERLEPHPLSVRLQALATNVRNSSSGEEEGRPAVLLSGNLRIPGSDPNKPLVISAGGAHFFGSTAPWRILVGASMDLGVARLIFGG